MTQFDIAMTPAECGARQREAVKLPPAIASRWIALRSAWMHWLARHRLSRSIAHLDDRLLADIGLGPEDLGVAERYTRHRAADLEKFFVS